MTEDTSLPSGRELERHVQSGLMALLAALSGWMALTVQNATVQIATLTEKVIYLERQLGTATVSAYSVGDAAKDLRLRDEISANLASRVLALEAKNAQSRR